MNTIYEIRMKKTVTEKTPASTKPETAPGNDAIILRIPKFNRSQFRIGGSSLTFFLVTVIVILTFILGMLTNKVLLLEKQSKSLNAAAPAAAGVSPTVAPPPQYVEVDNGHLPAKGSDNAKVTIVEFSDFECPFCEKYFSDAHNQIMKEYVDTGKVKFVYRHFPLTAIHPNAQKAAEASECANEQDQFWAFHDVLFETQADWSQLSATEAVTAWTTSAGELGMNTDQFKTCVDSGKYKAKVDEDTAAGDDAQVDGTPAFFINGYRLTGAQPFSEFQTVIDQELKK